MTMQRWSGTLRSPDNVDRALVIGCAVIWLAVIGVGVAATVALVALGTGGHPETASGPQTPWLLYAVIAISAVIILGAIPLLLRARRAAMAETAAPPRPAPRPTPARPAAPVGEAPTEKLRVFGSVDPIGRTTPVSPQRPPPPAERLAPEAVERMWLRSTAAIAAAMGTAMLAVATATYLMAVDANDSAWIALGIAGVVTVGMPAIPWLFLRHLRASIAAVSD
ncbi:MAG TPA: DUF2561 family protein [Mycobacterium sp.]|nr:DUF2561 family protein [Mycobacterium sp.]